MISVHFTGSSGNLYQIDTLLLDAGVSGKLIKKALNYKLSHIQGALISHSHGDHCKGVNDLIKAGIDIYCSEETAEIGAFTRNHRLNIIQPLSEFTVDGWKVLPFPLVHDVPNLGFLLKKDGHKILYAVDTNYIEYRFSGLTEIILGVNYETEALNPQAINISLIKRLLTNHMSLETAVKFFEANDLSRVRKIHIVHLSSSNAGQRTIQESIEKITGKENVTVYV